MWPGLFFIRKDSSARVGPRCLIRTVSPQVTKILVYSIADVVQSVAIEVDDYLCITEVSDYPTLVIYEYRS